MDTLQSTIQSIRQFRDSRDWMQFHSPKNLACSISIEANELLEHFQWCTTEESHKISEAKLSEISHEIADVAMYLIELADNLGISIPDAIAAKLAINEAKYPAQQVRGSSKKYSDYTEQPTGL